MTKTLAIMVGLCLLIPAAPGHSFADEPSSGGEEPGSGDPSTEGQCPEPNAVFVPEYCASEGKEEPDKPPLLRIYAGATNHGGELQLELCVETLFIGRFSLRACGTGRGLVLDKRDPDPELTRYQARLRLAYWRIGPVRLTPLVQAGLGELRAGTSEAEFVPGRGSSRQLALGPVGGGALQMRLPLGDTLSVVGEVHAGAAWFSRADELVVPTDELLPVFGANLGLGF